jgi:hypothetical protein
MYERNGMGWSEIPWYSWANTQCSSDEFDACVSRDPADQAWATSPAWIGGPQRCRQFRATDGETRSCTTAPPGSLPGTVYCCRRTALTPEAVQYAEESGVQPTPGGTLPLFRPACETHRSDRTLMRTAVQQALWDVQDRLCATMDPGPVDGTDRSSALRTAIQRVQRERALPITGQLDAATLRMIGFSSAEAQRIEGVVARTRVGVTPDAPPALSISPWIVAGGIGAAGFLAFAFWQFWKRR